MPTDYRAPRRPELTPRQYEVLQWVALGLTNARIAQRLGITEETVKRHLREIRLKLKARDRAHAVNEGWRLGYLGGRSKASSSFWRAG
jgi:DNA-binding CsgD family transcriptional regulator